jgi:hypothetical protein
MGNINNNNIDNSVPVLLTRQYEDLERWIKRTYNILHCLVKSERAQIQNNTE